MPVSSSRSGPTGSNCTKPVRKQERRHQPACMRHSIRKSPCRPSCIPTEDETALPSSSAPCAAEKDVAFRPLSVDASSPVKADDTSMSRSDGIFCSHHSSELIEHCKKLEPPEAQSPMPRTSPPRTRPSTYYVASSSVTSQGIGSEHSDHAHIHLYVNMLMTQYNQFDPHVKESIYDRLQQT